MDLCQAWIQSHPQPELPGSQPGSSNQASAWIWTIGNVQTTASPLFSYGFLFPGDVVTIWTPIYKIFKPEILYFPSIGVSWNIITDLNQDMQKHFIERSTPLP